MLRRLPLLLLGSLLLCAWAPSAPATMVVDRNILHFGPTDPASHDVTVTNRGREPLFIDVEVLEVLDPGSPTESRVPVAPDADVALLVSPGKLALAPGQQRLLRVVNLSGNDVRERVFRVTLRPVPAPARAEQSGIRVFVAYQLLVIVAPDDPRAELHSHRHDGRLIVENRGNANVLLHSGRQCPPGRATDDADCITFRGTRLYPGNSWTVETPYETPVDFTVTEGSRNAKRTF